MLRKLLIAVLALIPAAASANGYRGMPAGWPASTVGVPAVPVTAGYAAPPAPYYAARPVQSATTAYATAPTVSMAPTYGQPTTAYYRGSAGYSATPAVTAYMPASTPAYGISPPPGTMLQQERSFYGSAGALNFAPQAVPVYRTYYAPAGAGVTYYRPVTVYQPTTGQPVTCLQAVQPVQPVQTCGTAPAAPSCGSSGHGCGLGLFSWLWRGCDWGTCGSNRCTTGYCGTSCGPTNCAPTGCGQQPYYPTVPVTPVVPTTPIITQPSIPVVPAPSSTTPPVIGTPRIPPPPTRIPSTSVPADSAPSLSPGGLPSTGGTIITPGTTSPGSSYIPSSPSTGTPGSVPSTTPFPAPSGGTPATEYYPPERTDAGRVDSNRFSPPSPVESNTDAKSDDKTKNDKNGDNNSSRFAPPAGALPSGLRFVPDPDAPAYKQPSNRAPQLINPSDRSAALLGDRWAVVPAVWPTKPTQQVRHAQPNVGGRVLNVTSSRGDNNASRQLDERTNFSRTSAFVHQQEVELDDSGWTSGR